MEKIFNYIANNKGMALKPLLVFSLVLGVLLTIVVRIFAADLIPYAQNAADQILPIRVENGIVVEPAKTYKKIYLKDLNINFVIDTQSTQLDLQDLKPGIYLTKTTLYTVGTRHETRILPLSGDIDLPQGDYRDVFRSMVNWTAVLVLVFGSAFIFFGWFILSLFYAACSYIISAMMSRKYDFDLRVRLSVLTLITIFVASKILLLIGINISGLMFFVAVMLLQAAMMRRIPSNVEISKTHDEAFAPQKPDTKE